MRETRRFNSSTGETLSSREKETNIDYRFIEDPDLPRMPIGTQMIEEMRARLKPNPIEKRSEMIKQFGITLQESIKLMKDNYSSTRNIFEELLDHNIAGKVAYSWVYMHAMGIAEKYDTPIDINLKDMLQIIELVESKRITTKQGKDILRDRMLKKPVDLSQYINGCASITDKQIEEVLNKQHNKHILLGLIQTHKEEAAHKIAGKVCKKYSSIKFPDAVELVMKYLNSK